MNSDKFVVAVERSQNSGPFEAVETSAWTVGEAPAFTTAVPTEAADGFRQVALTASDESGIHEGIVGEWTYRFVYEVDDL